MTTAPAQPILGEAFAAYATSGHIGSGALRDFMASPLLFRQRHIDAGAPAPDTAAFAYGRYFHCLALEGDFAAGQRYSFPREPINRRTKEGKARAAELEALGRPIVDSEDCALALGMLAGLERKQTWRDLTRAGHAEAVFRTKLAGVPVQCRADWWNPAHADTDRWRRPLILDLKTVEHLADFPRHFDRYGYWLQAAFYQLVVTTALGLEGYQPRFVFAVCEKSAPQDCAFFEVDETTAELGRTTVLRALERLAGCLAAGDFPGEPDAIQTVSLPDYKLNRSAA